MCFVRAFADEHTGLVQMCSRYGALDGAMMELDGLAMTEQGRTLESMLGMIQPRVLCKLS